MKRQTFVLIALLWWMGPCPSYAQQIFFNKVQQQRVQFKNMFPDEGLEWVTNITQDIKGNMWFISAAGLVSYNGYSTEFYTHDQLNPNSLGGTRPECVYADKEGIIWIGFMGDGLDRLDPETNCKIKRR